MDDYQSLPKEQVELSRLMIFPKILDQPDTTDRICSLPILPDELLIQIFNNVNPMTVIDCILLNKRCYSLLINPRYLTKQHKIIYFFEKNLHKIDWQQLSQNQAITEDFFERHIRKVSWYTLSENEGLSLKFFEKHINNVNWYNLSGNSVTTLDFWYKHINKINWGYLPRNRSIPETFLCENLKKFDKDIVARYGSEKIVEKYLYLINLDWSVVVQNRNLSIEFFEKYIYKMRRTHWAHLWRNPAITIKFIIKHINEIIWEYLSYNPSITLEFVKEHIDKINFKELSRNTVITEEFVEEYIDKFDWFFLCQNPSLSENFYLKHIDKIIWKSLGWNTSLSIEFVNEHVDKLYFSYLCQNDFGL